MSRDLKSLVRLAVAWVICLMVVAAFHFALVGPQARALTTGRALATAKAERFSLLRGAKSARAQEQIKEEQEELERRYADFVLTSEQMNDLDFRIRAIAEKSGIREFSARHLGTVSKMGDTPLKQIAQRDLAVSFNCTFGDFLRFVNEMERHQPILIVDQFTLKTGAQKESGLSCMLDCCVLYQVGVPVAPAATAQ